MWINSTNLFDAAAGFGGYRESGFGREGGREGMWEYLMPDRESQTDDLAAGRAARASSKTARRRRRGASACGAPRSSTIPIAALRSSTARRSCSSAASRRAPTRATRRASRGADGRVLGEVGEGNRKDIRNAVEAAHAAAAGWAKATGHARAQILYYIAENLAARADEFARAHRALTGAATDAARGGGGVARLFTYAAWADKYDGAVHHVPLRGVALAMHEPIGVIGVACPDEHPLLGLVSLVAPAIAMGNTRRRDPVASARRSRRPTSIRCSRRRTCRPAWSTSSPARRDALAKTLAEHDDVDAVWYFGLAARA